MAAKLSRSSRKRVDGMIEHLEKGTLNLNKISNEALEELVSRAAISSVPDGFSSNTRPNDGGSRSGAGIKVKDENGEWDVIPVSGVEATMFARERPPKDELSKRVKHIENLLKFVYVAASEIQSNITEIHRVEEEKKQRIVSTPCLTCDATAEVSGYCRPCYNNWDNYGRPDRLKWELFRNQSTNVDGILLVAECPPPSHGRTARRGPYRTVLGVDVEQNLTNVD